MSVEFSTTVCYGFVVEKEVSDLEDIETILERYLKKYPDLAYDVVGNLMDGDYYYIVFSDDSYSNMEDEFGVRTFTKDDSVDAEEYLHLLYAFLDINNRYPQMGEITWMLTHTVS